MSEAVWAWRLPLGGVHEFHLGPTLLFISVNYSETASPYEQDQQVLSLFQWSASILRKMLPQKTSANFANYSLQAAAVLQVLLTVCVSCMRLRKSQRIAMILCIY